MPNFNLTRKLNRKQNFNYSKEGWYFLTICTEKRFEYFGFVKNRIMNLNVSGEIAEKYLTQIPKHYDVSLTKHVVMPNHIHLVIWIKPKQISTRNARCRTGNARSLQNDGAPRIFVGNGQWPFRPAGEAGNSRYGVISKIVNSFKNVCTKEIRLMNPQFSWQKSFYDRIIRTDEEAYFISKYIDDNPKNWNKDRNDIKLNEKFEEFDKRYVDKKIPSSF